MMPIRKEAGAGFIELLISLAIASIASVAVLSLIASFYQNGYTISNVSDRTNDAALVDTIAAHFLTQANYQGGVTALTLSAPTLQQGNNAPNDGVTIQWVPFGSESICTGTLVDQTEYVQNEGGAEPLNGMAWVETGPSPCQDGTAFFPINNQWGFSITNGGVSPSSPTISALSNCPGNQQGVVLSNTYQFRINTTNIYKHGGTQQDITICMPNVQ